MFRATAKTAVHYWALAALTASARAYVSAKTWGDRGGGFSWGASLVLIAAILLGLLWWNPYSLGWFMGGGFIWIQVMGIDNDEENERLRKAVNKAGIPGKCRAVFNRLDRWLLDGPLSPAGQQRLKAAALARKLPPASVTGNRSRF